MKYIKKIQKAINGYKLYLLGVAGIIGVLVAWADPAGTVGNWEALQGIWAILLGMAGRSAIGKISA